MHTGKKYSRNRLEMILVWNRLIRGDLPFPRLEKPINYPGFEATEHPTEAILEFLRENPRSALRDVVRGVALNANLISWHLSEMMSKGLVTRRGRAYQYRYSAAH